MSWLHTHLVMPLAESDRYAGLPARLRSIRRFERMSEKEQRNEQKLRLQRLLQHAYDTVPYYRQQFDQAGFRASDVSMNRPLPLPVLTRDHLRNAAALLLSTACKLDNLRMAASSGTTSTPITFYRDVDSVRDKGALKLTLDGWSGFKAGDSVMMLWGAHRDLAMEPNWRWRLYEEVLMRQTAAPCGIINEEILERFRLRYEKQRPKVLYGYSTVLAAFASYLQERGMRHRPEIVIATAEVLSDQNRRFLQSVFGIKPFIYYGSRDVGMIGAECPEHEGLHFHPWGSYVEFDPIGQSPDGTVYRLLVTDLLNYGQPFIRYDTGDCVTLTEQSCSCGSWFPLVRQILGRVADGIVLADGGIVPGVTIGCQMTSLRQNFRAISQVQVVQKSHQHLHLRYVLKESGTAESQELESICDGIDALTQHRMQWTLEKVADIPREVSGKLRLCISEMQTPISAYAPPLQSEKQSVSF